MPAAKLCVLPTAFSLDVKRETYQKYEKNFIEKIWVGDSINLYRNWSKRQNPKEVYKGNAGFNNRTDQLGLIYTGPDVPEIENMPFSHGYEKPRKIVSSVT